MNFDDEPILEQPFTIDDPNANYTVLSYDQAEEKAKKVDYSLGKDSPGVEPIRTQLLGGDEAGLRATLASSENTKFYTEKRQMIARIAASGKKLTPDEEQIVMGLTQAEFNTDPATILEKKFAEKYVNDTLLHNAAVMGTDWSKAPEWGQEADIATNVVTNQQWFANFYQNAEAEYSQNRHIVGKIGDFIAQVLPFVPWWQQERALANRPGVEGLQGKSMAANVRYLWMLPDEQRRKEFQGAYQKLKGFNELDALDFARAMVAFPTSDEYIANTISLADYSTIGSFFGKLVGKGVAKRLDKEAAEIPFHDGPIDPKFAQAAAQDAEVVAKNAEQVKYKAPEPVPQGEMFLTSEMTGQARDSNGQWNFRFMNDPEFRRGDTPPLRGSEWYHGSPRSFSEFKTGQGAWFTKDENVAAQYSKGDTLGAGNAPEGRKSPTVYRVDVNEGNVFDLRKPEHRQIYENLVRKSRKNPDTDTWLPTLKSEGFLQNDGLPGFGRAREIIEKLPQFDSILANEGSQGVSLYVKDATNRAKILKPEGQPRGRDGRVLGKANRNALIEGSYRDEAGNIVEGTYGIPKRGPAPEVNPQTGIYRGQGGRFQKATTHGEQYDLDFGARMGDQLSFDLPSGSVRDVRQNLADAVKAVEGPKMVPEQVLSANGQVTAAVLVDAPKRATIGSDLRTVADMQKELPTFASPWSFTQDAKSLHREAAQRLARTAQEWNKKLFDTFDSLTRGSRLTPEALAVGLKESEQYLRNTYNRFSDSVINVRHTPADMSPENVDKLSLQLGTPDAKPFPSLEKATLYRDEVYKIPEANIYRQGNSWYLELDRHVQETSDSVRQALVVPKNTTETNLFKMFANRLLSSESLLPEFQSAQRKVATHPMQQMRKEMADMVTQSFNQLSSKEKKELNQILMINRDMERRGEPGKRGDWFNTAGELEQAFYQKFNTTPSEAQVAAYDTLRRAHDFEWFLSNVAQYRDKARQGAETFQVRMGDKSTQWFEAIPHKEVPWNTGKKGEQDAGVYVWNSETQKGTFYYMFDMTDSERKYVNTLVNEKGHRVLQVFDPNNTFPLDGIAKTKTGDDLKDVVNYIIADGVDRRPLSWNQTRYEPGPHSIYKNEWYVAAPDIREGRNGKMTYFGDKILLNVSTEAEAKQWSSRMQQAIDLLRFGKDAEATAFIEKNLPYTRKEFDQLLASGMISKDNPVAYKEAGRRTLDTIPDLRSKYENGNLIDSTRNIHDPSAVMDKSFLAERDMVQYNVMDGPRPTLVPAEQLDPFVAFNRAFGQRLRNIWLNDYKIGAVETWIQNAVKNGLMKPSERVLSAHPTYFLYEPQWNPKADPALRAAAEAERRAIVNFIGARNELGDAVGYVGTKIQNAIYERFGQGKVLDAALSATADPVSFLRGVAFHTKLGFFNPVQFFVQAQSLSHVIAVAGPTNAVPGMAAGFLSRVLAHNPAQIDTIANVAKAFGWKPAEFKEMFEKLQSSGLYQVAGEAVLRDDVFDPKLFQSKVGQFFLDSGATFFNEGERLVRLTSFATAYREWKAANKFERLGDRAMADIMQRSDLLSLNMTRASSASWQQGAMSVPTQFWAYNARMMEQFLGKRLTVGEKASAFAMYSALYGVPISTGAVVGVWPIYDSFREAMIERGIDMDKSAFTKVFQDGVFQYLQSLTGKESNIAARYGPGNNSQIKDIWTGEKSFLDAVFGASGTIIGDMFKATTPFVYHAASVFGATNEYPLMASDWMTLARNISTVDLGAKMYAAAQYQKWLTKSGQQISSADDMDAFLTVLGLTPIKAANAYITQEALQDLKKSQDKYERRALEDYRRALQAAAAGDQAGFEAYSRRARTAMEAGDFNAEQKIKIYRRAVTQNKDMADTVNSNLFRQAPASRKLDMLDFIQRKN